MWDIDNQKQLIWKHIILIFSSSGNGNGNGYGYGGTKPSCWFLDKTQHIHTS